MKNKIKEYRKKINLTQDDLAVKTNVTRQTINAIENNKYDPTLKPGMAIAKNLGYIVEEVFFMD